LAASFLARKTGAMAASAALVKETGITWLVELDPLFTRDWPGAVVSLPAGRTVADAGWLVWVFEPEERH
jgi:hypothetical protein